MTVRGGHLSLTLFLCAGLGSHNRSTHYRLGGHAHRPHILCRGRQDQGNQQRHRWSEFAGLCLRRRTLTLAPQRIVIWDYAVGLDTSFIRP